MARSEVQRQYNRNNRSYRLQCQFELPIASPIFKCFKKKKKKTAV